MRLWSINPEYLDSKGLVALWRETLLAQKVLEGKTKGYKNHPQLIRFKEHNHPQLAVSFYLYYIYQEALKRSYNFNFDKIKHKDMINTIDIEKIPITDGQVEYELIHLKKKLKERDPEKYKSLLKVKKPLLHPIFIEREGDIADWENISIEK